MKNSIFTTWNRLTTKSKLTIFLRVVTILISVFMIFYIWNMTMSIETDIREVSQHPYYTSGGFMNGWPEMLLYPFGVIITLIIAFFFPRFGGILTLISLLGFHLVMRSKSDYFVFAPVVDMVAVPAILFIWVSYRKKYLDNTKQT